MGMDDSHLNQSGDNKAYSEPQKFKQTILDYLFFSSEMFGEASAKKMNGNELGYNRCIREATKPLISIYKILRPKILKRKGKKEIFKRIEFYLQNDCKQEYNLSSTEWNVLHDELAILIEDIGITDIEFKFPDPHVSFKRR